MWLNIKPYVPLCSPLKLWINMYAHTLFHIQMIPTKTTDSPIYAIKRPMLISLWLNLEKCYSLFTSSRNRYRFELSKEVLHDSVGQRAAKLTVFKVWSCRELKLEFETKTLNAKHRGLGSSALQCLYWPPKSTLSWKIHYFKSNHINKNHIMKKP